MAKKKEAPLPKYDYRKDLRKQGFKISRDGKITKLVLNKPKESAKPATEKVLTRLQAMTGVPAYKVKKYTKAQALNELARSSGYKNYKAYQKQRKTGKHKAFERMARKHGVDAGLGSKFEKMFKAYADSGYEDVEKRDLLFYMGEIDVEDFDKYTED